MEIHRGLGRGLGALFPSANAGEAGSSQHAPAQAPASPADARRDDTGAATSAAAMAPPSDLGLVTQEVIYAGLDALLAAMPLQLCAYLHLAESAGPQLYLRTPDLSSMDANECFALFGALRDALDANEHDDRPLEVRGFHAISMNTRGARSRGLHVVGRRDGELDEGERVLAGRLAHAIAAATHWLEAISPTAAEPTVRLSVEVVEGGPQADISLEAGGQTRTGRGSAESPFDAVARAVLDAFDGEFELVHAGLQEAGGERIAVVIVQNPRGSRGLGSALGQDPLQATAAAALEAVRRLRESGEPGGAGQEGDAG